MAVDCYMTSCATDPLRIHLARATLTALLSDPALSVVLLRTKPCDVHVPNTQPRSTWAFDVSPEEFQRKRRMEAASRSLTAWYVLADDDVLPMDANWVTLALSIAQKHTEFGVIGLRERGIAYQPYDGYQDDDLEEVAEAGGLCLMRRGILLDEEWPKTTKDNDYDMRLANALRKKGLKVGLFKKLHFNHIGLGFSTATYNANGYKAVSA